MDIMTERNGIVMLKRIADKKRTTPIIRPMPQKIPFGEPAKDYKYFPRSSPEEQGVSSEIVSDFLRELFETKHAAINTATVLRHGRVIGEAEYYPYRFDIWHSCFSFSKTVTGIAIGLLIYEGKLSLDDRVSKIFANRLIITRNLLQSGITVRHLLTMTSGITFNEFGMITESDWVRCFLESMLRTAPGDEFNYNSMNSYMLSAIVSEITGQTLAEYLEPRLFAPMNITRKYWETCPRGISKGGWGLYLLPEDMAKLGQLILQKGMWEGEQLVPEAWITDMCTSHADVPAGVSDFSYGYQIWTKSEPRIYCLNGMFGQNTMIFPESDIVVTLTACNENIFHDNEAFEICQRYFGNPNVFGEALPKRSAAFRALKKEQKRYRTPPYTASKLVRRLNGGDVLPRECADWDGLSYLYSKSEADSAGLLPLAVQCIQNSFTAGTRRISFEKAKNKFFVSVYEGERIYRLPVGFGRARYAELKFGEDLYKTAVMGRFYTDEDGVKAFKLFVYFLELGTVRTIRFLPEGTRLVTKWAEKPGVDFFVGGVTRLLSDINSNPIIKGILDRGGIGLLRYSALDCYEPQAIGKQMSDN